MHINFLALESPSAAHKLKVEILTAIATLSTNPYRFPIYENEFIYNTKVHKMVISKSYLVLYEIVDNIVNIEKIINSKQEIELLLLR
jgi:plasmid stabilization system protein ParE